MQFIFKLALVFILQTCLFAVPYGEEYGFENYEWTYYDYGPRPSYVQTLGRPGDKCSKTQKCQVNARCSVGFKKIFGFTNGVCKEVFSNLNEACGPTYRRCKKGLVCTTDPYAFGIANGKCAKKGAKQQVPLTMYTFDQI